MLNGFINVCKPVGLTASDVVVKIKRQTGAKTGHLGTLDPGAAGVLPIALGKATKLFDFLVFKNKQYRAFFTFGATTDTLDSYGIVTEKSDKIPSEAELKSAAQRLTGELMQLPPQFSAKSVNGVRAYDMARKGEFVELSERKVTVSEFQLIRQADEKTFVFDVTCSGGTYIRSLARDIAALCGTTAYMSGLIRLSSGAFMLENTVTLDEIAEQGAEKYILPIDYPLSNVDRIDLDKSLKKQLSNGVKVPFNAFDGLKRLYIENEFYGLAASQNGELSLEYNLLV